MTIDDLKLTFDIHATVVDLVETVAQVTGKPIEFRIDRTSQVPASVKIARFRMPHHLLKIRPDQAFVVSYLIANKCANILRMWRLHTEDRKVVATSDRTLAAAGESIRESMGAGSATLPDNIISMLVTGVINQLSNLPVQVRIERWVASNLPDLRSEQRVYLERDVAETVAGLGADVERLTPPIVFTTSNAMTYAYVRGVGELVGTNWTQRYNNFQSIVRKGKDLYALIGDDDDGSHTSDVKLVDVWGSLLGITSWYVWQDFETMPESYYDDVTN